MTVNKKNWNRVVRYMNLISGGLYTAMFLLQAGYRFLLTTEFPILELMESCEETPLHILITWLVTDPQWILLVIVLLRYIFVREYDRKEYAAAAALGIGAFYIFSKNGEITILVYLLLILGAKGLPFKKMMRLYTAMCFGIMLLTIAASQTGLIENHIWNVENRNIRIAFGFNYPTDFSAHIFFLCLCWWYIRGKALSYAEAALTACLGVFTYVFCEARFSTVMLLLLGLVMIYCRCRERIRKKGPMPPFFCTLLTFVPLFCSVWIHGLSMFYDKSNELMMRFNVLLSDRLGLAKRAIDVYGFSLWGADIPMLGNGGRSTNPEKYFYIDSSYLQFSLLHGVVVLGLILLLLWLAAERARAEEDWILFWILALAAVHGTFEQHLFELEQFPFLLLIFADLSGRKENGKKKKKAEEANG